MRNSSISDILFFQGETRAAYDALRSKIIHCLAQVEALIDFGEGEDLEEGVYEQGILIRTSHVFPHFA